MRPSLRSLSAAGLAFAAVSFNGVTAVADPVDPGNRPIAQGNFTTAGEPGWIFFKPQGFGGHGCAISPDGTVGCDIVPGRWPDGTPVQEGQPGPPGFYSCEGRRCPLPPAGVTQTVVTAQAPAEYVRSDAQTFTRDVGVLPTGYRLVNGNAWCSLSEQGTLRCVTGANGFVLNATYGLLD